MVNDDSSPGLETLHPFWVYGKLFSAYKRAARDVSRSQNLEAKSASSAIVVMGLLTAVVVMKLYSLKLGHQHPATEMVLISLRLLKHVVFQSLLSACDLTGSIRLLSCGIFFSGSHLEVATPLVMPPCVP